MKRIVFSMFIFSFICSTVYSQCAECPDNNKSFCYEDSIFANYCARFTDGSSQFTLIKGSKKPKCKTITYSKVLDTKALLELASNKKLKISAADILFIQRAFDVWSIEQRKLGHDYTESGLGIKVYEKGEGEIPEEGKKVNVHYTGYLEDGTKFDSSVDRGTPFSFTLGRGQVIKGWDEGVALLPIGTKALLQIPADLGYGNRGAGGRIPPGATLYFEIEVLGVE